MEWRKVRQELCDVIGRAERATEAAKKMLEKVDFKTLEIRMYIIFNNDHDWCVLCKTEADVQKELMEIDDDDTFDFDTVSVFQLGHQYLITKNITISLKKEA